VVVTCILVVPFAISAAYSANRTRIEREDEVREQARSVAATVASYLTQYVAGLDTVALVLSRHPAVLALDRAQCDPIFADILKREPLLSNIALIDPRGNLKGTGLPSSLPSIAVSPTFLDEIVRSGKPVVTTLVTGPISGKPAVVLAYPVRDQAGTLVGVLALGLNVMQFQTFFHLIPLPDASVITLTDANSRVLARSLDAERYVGKIITPRSAQPQDVAGIQELTGLDGVERFYGNAVVDRGPWLLSVGIPTGVAMARAFPVWRRGVAIITSGIATVLLLALLLSTLLSRGVNRMREAAQRIANGDLSPPPRVPAANLELAALQDSFITMAANLRAAHDALDRQIEQERKMREAVQLLQRQVVRQERLAAVGVLVSGVAHELNNPLQAILGTAELLERRPELTPEALEELTMIKTQSGRAREIIRNLSRFSSQQSGPPSPVDLREVIAEVVQLRRRNLDGASISLEQQTTSTQLVYANFTELEQVALNFVINAQQAIEAAGRPTGRILIRVFDVGAKVRVEVADDGPGVSAQDEPKLFQPFFTTKPVGQGTGLGLSVSYGIIESYGGSIGYRSNAWGGATFYFELPAGDSSTSIRHDGSEPAHDNDAPPLLHRPVPSRV
jgi:C4-dicarboxylate-specific signal transduction histidine kinase